MNDTLRVILTLLIAEVKRINLALEHALETKIDKQDCK